MRKVISLLTVLSAASLSGAQTFFDNINGYNAWSGASAWTLDGSNLSAPQTVAEQFTSGATGTVGSVQLSVQEAPTSATASGTVSIFADSGDTIGALLGTRTFSTCPAWDSASLLTLTGPAVSLTSGAKYWIEVTPDANSALGWRMTPTGTFSLGAWQTNAVTPYTYFKDRTAGIKITGAVPEPATYAAFGFGLFAFIRRKRVRRSSKQFGRACQV